MSSPLRLLALAFMAALYWAIGGTALFFITAYGLDAMRTHEYCRSPGNQLGLPSCDSMALIILGIGFFGVLAVYSLILWKVARRSASAFDPSKTFE